MYWARKRDNIRKAAAADYIGAFHVDQRIQIRQELEEGDQRARAVVSLQLIFIPTRWFFKFKMCRKLKK